MSRDPLTLYLETPSRRRFAELVAGLRTDVLGIAWRATGDADLAEDVAQEVLLALLDPKFSAGEVRSPRGLLVTMTLHAARSRLRSESRRRRREEESVRRREEARGMDPEQVKELREAVADLPDELRECVELRYLGGLPLGEVAKATGLALRTVSEKLRSARDRLKVRLADAAFAGPLAFLAGEQEDGLPGLEPSGRYLERTGRLGARARRRSFPKAAAVLAGGVVVLLLVLWVAKGARREDRPPPAPEVVATRTGSEATDPATGPATTDRDAPGGSETADVSPAASLADPTDPETAATGFVLRVVDEEGNLLRDGELELALIDFRDFDQLERLKAWQGLLREHALADANPLSVTDLPPFADGLEIRASARSPGRAPSPPLEFTVRRGEVREQSILVPLPREVEVEVRDRVTGEPVEGAAVVSLTELHRRGIEGEDVLGRTGPGSAITLPDGRCRLGGLGEEPHDLEVHAVGYVAERVSEHPLDREARVRLAPIRTPGRVLVRVIGRDGGPLAGARVQLNADRGSVRIVRVTDDDGRCTFDPVTPGSHAIRLEFEDIEDLDRVVLGRVFAVEPGEDCRLELGYVDRRSRIVVVVRDPAGRPKEGVAVDLSGPTYESGETDADGRLVFEGLAAGSYRLAQGEWSYGAKIEIDAEAGERTVTLTAGEATVRGKTAPGADVVIRGVAETFAEADEDGNFEVKAVPPGTFEVHAWIDERISAPATVEVKGKASPEPLELRLVPAGRVLVRFRDADRPALAAADFRLVDDRGRTFVLRVGDGVVCDLLSNRLLPGRYEVEVRSAGRPPQRITVNVKGGEDSTLEIGS